MRGGKRQAFSRGDFFRAFFEGVWDAFLGGNGYDVLWGAVREATLSEWVTAPLARMSLEEDDLMYAPGLVLVVSRTVCAQLEALWGGKDPTALPATMPVTGEEPVPLDASGNNGYREVEVWATTGPQYSNNTCVNKITVPRTTPQAVMTQNQASFNFAISHQDTCVATPRAECRTCRACAGTT
jgi:hypothetical protein